MAYICACKINRKRRGLEKDSNWVRDIIEIFWPKNSPPKNSPPNLPDKNNLMICADTTPLYISVTNKKANSLEYAAKQSVTKYSNFIETHMLTTKTSTQQVIFEIQAKALFEQANLDFNQWQEFLLNPKLELLTVDALTILDQNITLNFTAYQNTTTMPLLLYMRDRKKYLGDFKNLEKLLKLSKATVTPPYDTSLHIYRYDPYLGLMISKYTPSFLQPSTNIEKKGTTQTLTASKNSSFPNIEKKGTTQTLTASKNSSFPNNFTKDTSRAITLSFVPEILTTIFCAILSVIFIYFSNTVVSLFILNLSIFCILCFLIVLIRRRISKTRNDTNMSKTSIKHNDFSQVIKLAYHRLSLYFNKISDTQFGILLIISYCVIICAILYLGFPETVAMSDFIYKDAQLFLGRKYYIQKAILPYRTYFIIVWCLLNGLLIMLLLLREFFRKANGLVLIIIFYTTLFVITSLL